MQHLLDFIHEHTVDNHLYFAVASAEGTLELSWERTVGADAVWQVRPYRSEAPPELVHCGDLLDHLELLGVDMDALQCELQAMIVTQVAFADVVLREARQVLGQDVVQRTVIAQRVFAAKLQAAVERLAPPAPSLQVHAGGGVQTATRTDHLTLVR